MRSRNRRDSCLQKSPLHFRGTPGPRVGQGRAWVLRSCVKVQHLSNTCETLHAGLEGMRGETSREKQTGERQRQKQSRSRGQPVLLVYRIPPGRWCCSCQGGSQERFNLALRGQEPSIFHLCVLRRRSSHPVSMLRSLWPWVVAYTGSAFLLLRHHD